MSATQALRAVAELVSMQRLFHPSPRIKRTETGVDDPELLSTAKTEDEMSTASSSCRKSSRCGAYRLGHLHFNLLRALYTLS